MTIYTITTTCYRCEGEIMTKQVGIEWHAYCDRCSHDDMQPAWDEVGIGTSKLEALHLYTKVTAPRSCPACKGEREQYHDLEFVTDGDNDIRFSAWGPCERCRPEEFKRWHESEEPFNQHQDSIQAQAEDDRS